ncbi:hypothetical protein ACTQ33_01035 [Candidatus Avoscillospira sp. LCP25S3_F1]|uniref:hypothetical protein n=1 Tax=Candidatus Avoscillospira sp. LCP25S3_F1 TaxID=3438825 RepID=UPI003F93E64A
MATITATDNTRYYELKQFLGLNESLDGDTQLAMGEASVMENWRITPQYHLRIRPGLLTKWRFSGPVKGLWTGQIDGEDRVLAAADGAVWELLDDGQTKKLATVTDDAVTFFPFSNKVYFLNGHEYLSWDGGDSAAEVEGYIPLVITAATPTGGGTKLENINRLTAKRRARFSADGEALDFQLPEKNLASIDKVEKNAVLLESSKYTVDLAKGTVTFLEKPEKGVNNIEIWYSAKESYRTQVTSMRFVETYNGNTDTRVFLYGDGSNKTIYSGVTEHGQPSAEYFPDLYEIAVDSDNTPITGMIKQFSYLMIFKTDGAFSTQYSATTLTDGTVTAGFYISPINREIGNEAPGQVRSVYNFPRTMYAGNLYDWQTTTTGRDERRAKLITNRVTQTMHSADPKKIVTFDNEREQEYYLFLNDVPGTVLIHRYQYDSGGDVWYRYTGIPAMSAIRKGEDVYFGLRDGRVCLFTYSARNDDGKAIACRWESGNMDFDYDYRRKYSTLIWVSLKPDNKARVNITARTDKRSTYTVKYVPMGLATFLEADFRHWSFITNRNPQIERVKLKIKKFAFYKLVLEIEDDNAVTTVLGVDMRVRYTGYVK